MRALIPEAPAGDVHAFLARHEAKELLRFVIVGSVDDGKSTLVGRLLFELGAVYDDQLDAVRKASKQVGVPVDFSLITDGLEAEREQGITIDVAYRYFTTAARKFIVADTPGHVQYTRNMVTGASTADVAVVLVDARLGVLEQTRRHATLAALLGIPHLLVAVNKMDLVGWEQARFDAISAELRAFCAGLALTEVTCVPVSALFGDNVVQAGTHAPWYRGPTVLGFLETVPAGRSRGDDLRFPVQLVLRPNLAYRGFAGRIASGGVRRGDEVVVLPSGRVTRVAAIDTFEGELDEAFAPQSVTLRLADEVDCSRGDVITHPQRRPRVARSFDADLVWLHEQPLDPRRTYLLKHGTETVRVHVDRIRDHLDLHTLERTPAATLSLNDIGRVTLTCHRPILFDAYAECRATGSFIVIDALSNLTVGAGLITGDGPGTTRDEAFTPVTAEERRARLGQVGTTLWLGTGDETRGLELAHAVERRLFDGGHLAAVVTAAGQPATTVAIACRQLTDAGLVAIVAGTDATRVRAEVGTQRVIEVALGPTGEGGATAVGHDVDRVLALLDDRRVLTR